jgi:predicted GNAT superfamily acetyltransferase
MLNISDLVVVTTDYIKNYYNKRYGVPLSNIVAAPNLLPRWWFGDRYDPEKKVK